MSEFEGHQEVRDEKGSFEGFEPRECGEHRTVGSHRAWCYTCHEWCYPRIAAACNGCRNPVIEKLLDDMADVLARMTVGWKPGLVWMTAGLDEHPDVVAVMARYRDFKGSE